MNLPGNLKSGWHIRRWVAVAVSARWILLLAVLAGVRVDTAFAQRSLASVLLPSDSSGAKRAAAKSRTPKSNGFLRAQIEHERVLAARVEKRFEVKKLFRERSIAYPAQEIFVRVFKREQELEMWVRPQGQDMFVLLKTYTICALDEKPGPKRVQGDLRTPEGFYFIDDFNPRSGYYLSLKVNYPNESDRILGDGNPLGGDIFIHGGCKTAGCMALTDENIKEVYVLAIETRDRGQNRIPVHIFPARLSDENLDQLVRVFSKEQPNVVDFWSNLKTGYDFFEKTHTLPLVTVNQRGRYRFATPAPVPAPTPAATTAAAAPRTP